MPRRCCIVLQPTTYMLAVGNDTALSQNHRSWLVWSQRQLIECRWRGPVDTLSRTADRQRADIREISLFLLYKYGTKFIKINSFYNVWFRVNNFQNHLPWLESTRIQPDASGHVKRLKVPTFILILLILFWILLPNVIKIDRYNFELYRFKVCAFFLRHSIEGHGAILQWRALWHLVQRKFTKR